MSIRDAGLREQYRDSSNFRKRTALAAKFGTNRYGWYRWVFEQFQLKPGAAILELGCGPGNLWKPNLERTPASTNVVLSDFSAGMLTDARHNLGANATRVSFCQLDAAVLPFRASCFDAVVANMMFYHVNDRPASMRDIRRVLAPNGAFYATTTGGGYMREIQDTALAILGVNRRTPSAERFNLESGYGQLTSVFRRVETRDYENSLRITDATPLLEYYQSMTPMVVATPEKWAALRQHFERIIGERGEIFVSANIGMLIARD
jgi:ubiquinone/menaquinone biosynthesis C-methylase UbiE